MDKKELRKQIHSIFRSKTETELDHLSRQITNIMMTEEIWKEKREILLFLTFGKELETRYLISSALEQGKRVAVPRIYGQEMKFHYLNSLEDEMEINRWGIREPFSHREKWVPGDEKALMITPGLAFGLKGERLGRGGGFYDRYLSRFKSSLVTVGICLEEQIKEGIPVNQHDMRLDALCTNRRFLQF